MFIRVDTVVIKYHQLISMKGGKSLFYTKLVVYHPEIRAELRAGTDGEAKEKCYLLPCSMVLYGIFNLLSYRTQDHQPMCGTTRSELGLHNSHYSRTHSTAYPQANLVGSLSHFRFPLPNWITSLCQADINASRVCTVRVRETIADIFTIFSLDHERK